jgi:hypothetical protein
MDNDSYDESIMVELNSHAMKRCKERKIRKEEIAAALLYGYSESKQGDCFYALTTDMLPESSGLYFSRSEGLVVVCNKNSGVVKTCYRRRCPVIFIKKKRKYRKASDDDVLNNGFYLENFESVHTKHMN